MKKVLVTIVILFVLIAGWLIILRTSDHQNMSPADKTATERSPNFSLQDYSGKTVAFADFSGRPIVINSWAAWCTFCKRELPDFATVQKEFGDKVVIIAVDRSETLDTAKKYTDELGVTDNLIFLLDPNDSFYRSIGGFSMPETIFVDKDGNIAVHKRGVMNLQEMRDKIGQILPQ